MRIIFLLYCLFIFFISSLFAQKPVIDTSVIGKWPVAREPKISNNGKYVLYKIRNQPLYSSTLIIQAVNGSWKKEFPGLQSAIFSNDSRKAYYVQGKDSLCMLTLGSDMPDYIASASSFQLFNHGKNEWIAYRSNTADKPLVIQPLGTKKIQVFKNVTEYLISKNGVSLIYVTEVDSGMTKTQTVTWANLNDNQSEKSAIIWKGNKANSFILDNTGTQLAFMVNSDNNTEKEVWYYNNKNEEIKKIVDNRLMEIPDDLKSESISNFSTDGKRIVITLKEKDYPVANEDRVKVDVWHYRDARIQSQQLVEDVAGTGGSYIGPRSYSAIIDIPNQRIIRLQHQYEKLQIINDTLGLIVYREGHEAEENWNQLAQPKYYLISLKTGERKIVNVPFREISPEGKYLLGKDNQGNWINYDPAIGKSANITKSVSAFPEDKEDQLDISLHNRGLTFSGIWLPDNIMLMYDKYDIWQIDPSGLKSPVNLTNGYGRKNKITFRIINYGSGRIGNNDVLLLDAFNHKNKDNGFYQMVAEKQEDPTRLIMGPYVFTGGDNLFIGGERPVRAHDVKAYIVMRSTANTSPNYFWTNDFKSFMVISDVHPENKYNWITSELKEFETLDGRTEQGILYKPENFDPTKKYPIIIHYYEEKSHQLNQYLRPDYSDGDINIPFFVSQGYLVFVPNIHYNIGEVGQSAGNSIIAAGKFLSKFPFVDAKRMGLAGHSFGASETDYVITHSNLFAAACADAGATNYVSKYDSYELNTGVSLQGFVEREQIRMGVTLWENPDPYIKNSPIFEANKVNTPLLMINNKKDAIVHFEQGLQFFLALRRLGKTVWMLQYDGEQHTILQKKNKRDLTIRITQFFDHFLKGAPAPKWMLDGIPAKLKGIETGYEIDSSHRALRQGLLTPEEKEKVGNLKK